jgi:hypothetical protein
MLLIVVIHVVVSSDKIKARQQSTHQCANKKEKGSKWEHNYFHIWISLLIVF